MRKLRITRPRLERGFCLLEILVTVVVISIGLLGLAGLQLVGLRATNSAHEHTLASLLAQDIEERIRANPNGNYHHLSIASSSVNCIDNPCDAGQINSFDGSQWYFMLHSGGDNTPILPNADIAVTGSGNNYTVTITWGNDRGPQTLVSSFSVS
jgi:type IV pilus assembly protein PilV